MNELEVIAPRRATLSLAVAGAATLLALANYTAPNTTVPETASALGAGVAGQVWILGGIALGLAALLLVAGGLADDHGRKRVFVIGAGALAGALAVGALATTTWVFVAARIVQGGASAALIAAGLGMVGHAYPAGPARVRATGIWGAMLSAGLLVGPIVSAALAEPLGWRAVYWLFAGGAIALMAAAVLGVPESRAARRRRIDVPGVLTLGLGVAALIAALTAGRDGWLRPGVLAAAVLALLLVAAFAAVESRSREPLLDLRLFRRPLFLASTGGALVTGLAVIGIMAYLPTVLQREVGQSPLTSAAVLGIWAGVSFATAFQARRLRMPASRQLALSLGLSAVGELALIGVVDRWSWIQATVGLAIAGAGSGIGNAALARLAIESVPPDRASLGSGANNAARYIGAALGVALIVTIVTGAGGVDVALLVSAGLALAGAGLALLTPAGSAPPRTASRPPTRRGRPLRRAA